MDGVDIHSIIVESAERDKTTLKVRLTVAGDSEFEALEWLLSVLNSQS